VWGTLLGAGTSHLSELWGAQMSHAYNDNPEDIAKSYRRIHANGEETHVHILSCGEDRYVVVAADVDPREFAGGGAACLGYAPSIDAAHERAEVWMEQHPKGVAPDGDDGPGLAARIWGALQKLDQSENQQTEDNNA